MTRRVVVGATFVALLAAAALARSDDRAFDKKSLKAAGEGRAVYLTYCAGCHGTDGHGASGGTDQQMYPDLTLIAVRDGGFNRTHVSNHVSGRYLVGDREMPCWGKALRGTWPKGEAYAARRVLVVTKYLDFVQEPEAGARTKP